MNGHFNLELVFKLETDLMYICYYPYAEIKVFVCGPEGERKNDESSLFLEVKSQHLVFDTGMYFRVPIVKREER